MEAKRDEAQQNQRVLLGCQIWWLPSASEVSDCHSPTPEIALISLGPLLFFQRQRRLPFLLLFPIPRVFLTKSPCLPSRTGVIPVIVRSNDLE